MGVMAILRTTERARARARVTMKAMCSHLNRKNEKSSALEMIPSPWMSIIAKSA